MPGSLGQEAGPSFGHLQDLWLYQRNVREGKPLCARCHGGGNEMWSMYKACSACSGSGVDDARLPKLPEPPKPVELVDGYPLTVGGPCVAPSWPDWATTEDGDFIWIRLDQEARAAEIAWNERYGIGIASQETRA